jgi:hypothetical protein
MILTEYWCDQGVPVTTSVNYSRLRVLAAILITSSGVGQVALLWFRDLSADTLIGAFIGVVYIIIGIGLLGQSRFTLFVAIAVPLAAAALLLNVVPAGAPSTLQIARLTIDLLVVVCSTLLLANTRD